ncbi:hypothetical protein [Nocardioides sp.]|uniref:hypothetical protein n=1 Tax=Nocardioides sp. TaxID=35761 RepID=UPI0035181FDB
MKCRHVSHDQPRMLADQHAEDCATTACPGCLPCTLDHCLVGWRGERGDCETHAPTVCPSCLGKVREHLHEVVRLAGMPLVEQVIRDGDPDSEASNLLGPAADPRQWRQRADHGHIYEPDSRLGWHLHPEAALGWLEMLAAQHFGHHRAGRITVASAGDYLDRNLHYLAADIEFDFADLAITVADCRAFLEQVLHDGEQRDTGAPCLKCDRKLVRTWEGRELPWRNRDGSHPLAPEDGWVCPSCKDWRSEVDYRRNVAQRHTTAADWLTGADMIERTGVTRGSLTGWASRGRVRKRTSGGRVVYRVADVLACLDGTADDTGDTDDAA